MKIVIAIPSGTMVHADFALSLASLAKATPKEIGVAFLSVKSSNICLSRNQAVAQAQRGEADYLLFLDSDMSFPPDLLVRLLAGAQATKAEVVGCNYVMRKPPFRSLVYGLTPAVQGLVEVAKLPTGAMLVDLKAFEKLKRPYFRFPYQEEAEGVEPSLGGEDYYFCDAVRAAGGRIFMDTDLSLQLTHWGDMGVQWSDNEQGYVTIVNP
jgi:glycosyltransferase involved in cell wall biosynthesis